jgi:hypothetical protein
MLLLLLFIVSLIYSLCYRRDILLVFLTFLLLLFLVGFPVTVHCEGIELVSWGQPETIGAHYRTTFTGAERAYWIIENVPPYLKGIIVGLILGSATVV